LVSTRGIVWSTDPDFAPDTVTTNRTADTGYEKGIFVSYMKKLVPGTTYYVRAYAVSIAGTSYGNIISFTTPDYATLTTNSPSQVANTSAMVGGTVTAAGGSPVTGRGIVWSTIPNFTPDASSVNTTSNGAGIGSFDSQMKDLLPDTKYYVRAYAITMAGPAYGQQVSFTSYPPGLSILTTLTPTQITGNTASSGGIISDEGGVVADTRGVVWSTQPGFNPDLVPASARTVQAGAGKGQFISNLTGLIPGTTYYVRAYASNRVGTAYGDEISFTTPDIPSLTTINISSVTGTTAISGGVINQTGGTPLTAQGICWSISPNPTIGLITKTSDAGKGVFTSRLAGLKPATKYYVRAYATNSIGTAYGNEISFTTTPILASVTTNDAVVTSDNSISSGGTITSDGGNPVTARGLIWSKRANFKPDTVVTNRTVDGAGIGNFISEINPMDRSTTYYIRAYATNSAGTAYGNQLMTSIFPTSPILNTNVITSITGVTAVSGGEIVKDGGALVTKRGIVWSTSQNPTISLLTKTSDVDFGDGTFTSSMTGLLQNTTYYVRAYAVNGIGVAYGLEKSFTTLAVPTLTATTPATNVLATSAVSGGKITDDGRTAITSRGIVWGTYDNPTVDLSTKTVDQLTQGIGSFTATLTGLKASTTYYVRAYATNMVGITYGSQIVLKTNTVMLPTLTTVPVTAIQGISAVGGGIVTDDGGMPVVTRGLVWSLTSSPTIALPTKIINGTAGTGTFSNVFAGLIPGTIYYIRAFATNSAGTAYGNELTFTTSAIVPSLSQVAIANLKMNSADGTANLVSDGGSAITDLGLIWNTADVIPDWLNNNLSVGASGTSITGTMTSLLPATKYFVWAYGKNIIGTGYSPKSATFTTPSLAILTTTKPSLVTTITANSGGTITSDGGVPVTARGLVWGIAPNPVIGGVNQSSNGTGAGGFVTNITGLTKGTKYYVRAYATNSMGTSYGNLDSLTTLDIPSVKTSPATNILSTSVTSGGEITNEGGASVTARGVIWDIAKDPTTALTTKTTDGTGPGVFTSKVGPLALATKYYFRAYATNSVGTAYGKLDSLNTPAVLPVVGPVTISNMTQNTATGTAAVTYDGGADVTARGFVWDTSTGPTLDNNVILSGTGIGSMSTIFTGLVEGPTYYVRAFATNSVGTSYSAEMSFKICKPFTVIHKAGLNGAPVDKTVTYGSFNSIMSGEAKCWITKNLGADQQATAVNDNSEAAAGWYWQFNKVQGYKNDGTTRTPNNAWTPWITGNSENSNWLAANDPCVQLLGGGWRIPTSTEWIKVIGTPQNWTGIADAYATELKLHAAGLMASNNGVLASRGANTSYWSSTQYSSTPYANYFYNGNQVSYADKAYAMPIRCLRDAQVKSIPSISNVTLPVANMTANSANGLATVANDGGASVTKRGLVWNTTGLPTLADNVVLVGKGTGDITGTITGLVEGPTYYVRAFATNSEGTAYSPLVNSFKICIPFTAIHKAGLNGAPVDKTVTYGVVNTSISGAARCWITQNLGSDQQAVAVNDNSEASAGWYWQFNRLQGYKNDGTNRTPNNAWTPWVGSNSENLNWLPANDPCIQLLGGGWRLPTSTEWATALAPPQNWTGAVLAYASELKVHNAGLMANNTSVLSARGTNMSYWSSTQYSSASYGNYFYNGYTVSYADKAYAMPVRCLRDTLTKSLPSVTNVTVPVPEMNLNSANGYATVTNDGGSAISARGLVWNTTGTPTLADNVINLGTGTGAIKSVLANLAEGPTYYVRAFATNSSGTNYSQLVSSFKICNPFTVIHKAGLNGAPVDKTVTYGTISTNISGAARCWITQNLGSDQQATAVGDATEASAGWYWQFNRLQGYKNDGTNRTPNNAWTPWIGSISENLSWSPANDPCIQLLGGGWRLPTSAEWAAAAAPPQNWGGTAAAYASELKLHNAGLLTYNSGALTVRGTNMSYWTSTQYTSSPYGNYFYNGYTVSYADKANALPVRCLRDTLAKNIPSVTNVTVPVAEMTVNAANGLATVTNDGGSAISSRGLVWNTTGAPTLADNVINLGAGTGNLKGTLANLTEGPTYYVRAYATNSSGTNYSPLVSSFKICNPFTVIHKAGLNGAPVDKTVTYGTVNSGISGAARCWITQNLGADKQAGTVDDNTEASSGWYWQFNRTQGFKHDGITRTPNNAWTPWVTSNSENLNWLPGNDPCVQLLGGGWRLPTSTEWATAVAPPQNWVNQAAAYGSELKIHSAGYLTLNGAVLTSRGSYMAYWSSTQNASVSYGNILFNGNGVSYADKASGFPIRCLRDQLAKNAPSVSNVVIPVAEMTVNSANGSATVTNDGGAPVTARGLVWNTTGTPTIQDNVIALDKGTGVIKTTLANLAEGPTYYVRAYATNSEGTSYSQAVSSFKICNPFTVVHKAGINGAPVDKTVTYGTVSSNISGASKCWITQNLGADQQASSLADVAEASSGWYWQFNRSQGYKYDAVGRTPTNTVKPWVITNSENLSWLPANDPCALLLGTGWRLPTSTEWAAAAAPPQYWQTQAQVYSSELKLHGAGYLLYNNGTITGRGSVMMYWTSTQYSSTPYGICFFNTANSYTDKAAGVPVRCLKD